MLVSPRHQVSRSLQEIGDDDVEDRQGLPGESCERVCADQEENVVRKLVDPKLPKQDEVNMHYSRGHIPFRNWCPVCVCEVERESFKSSKGWRV